MKTIIRLLDDKNVHLQKFRELNETELANFREGKFDNVEIFYKSREVILDLIRCIDELLDTALMENEDVQTTSEEKAQILKAFEMKNELVTEILAQDLQILSVIEQTKSEIIKELRQVQSARKAVGAYKSGDFLNRLDEKA